jgi:hypothetical protein
MDVIEFVFPRPFCLCWILSSFYYVIYHNQTLELKIKTQNNAINRHDSYKYTERLISNSMNFLENEIDDDEM